MFETARPYPDGRWLVVPLRSAAAIADVRAMLVITLPPTIRARLARG